MPKNDLSKIKLNLIDKIINYFSPKKGLERIRNKFTLSSLQENGFITSGSHKRSMRAWNPKPGTADQDIIPKLDSLRSDSRDLYMNTPVATGVIRRLKTNVVGFGLRLQCRIDRELLGMNDETAEKWERNTEREFSLWADSPECDAARTLNFKQLTGLAFFSTLLSGDTFTILPKIKRIGQVYDLRIQLIEGDYVSNPITNIETNKIAGGIEIDQYGAPVAYYFSQIEPENLFSSALTYTGQNHIRIPAYGQRTGRKNIIHSYDKERPGQRRGYPFLAPVVEELKQLTRLSKSEIQAAIINSYFTVFIKSQNPVGNVLPDGYVPSSDLLTPGLPGVSVKNENDPRDDKIYEMGAANVIEMAENEDISVADPKRPNQQFDPFFTAIVKQIGTALGVPYGQLMMHFNESYSAARAALQESWKFCIERRTWLTDNFCRPIYKEWLFEAILKGRIEAPGFFNDPVIQEAWSKSAWFGPGQSMLDPLKETKAAILRVKNRLSTFENEYVALTGQDWAGAMDHLSREEKHLDNLGLNTELDAVEDGVDDKNL